MTSKVALPIERIENRILFIRGFKVLLDADLASLYGVQTRVLNQAVKRNAERFPADFMFQLSPKELEVWRSQAVISNPGAKMGLRRAPFVFTEHGALMAASLLNSPRAIETSLYVVRAFVRASSGKGDGSISTGNQVSTRGSVEKWQHWRPRSGPIRSFVAEPRKLAA